jgi:leucyl aminopeptidase
MEFKIVNKTVSEIEAELLIEFITKDEVATHKKISLLQKAGFSGLEDDICFLHEKSLLICGLDAKNPDDFRVAGANVIRALKNKKYETVKIAIENKEVFSALIEGIVFGGYEFNEYKSKPNETALKHITFSAHEFDKKELKTILEETLIVANATCFTRDIVNMAPQEIYPQTLAELAQKLAEDNELTCKVLDEKALKKENMNAMLAVGRASIHESKLIHLTYKPKNPKKIISLVGKGLTYDSGGLSLKAATSMVSMKMDKAGACAVLGIMKAASELKLDIEIHGFIGAVENMIGGNAYKPDDVLVSRNGTTIEVRNTDAEGRLVLADVLDYAQEKVQADYIFDFATLTGACMVALGQYTTGLMGHSQPLFHKFYDAAYQSGELVGSLPFNKHLKKLLKSEIADISNTSSKPYGGAITAGLFLDKFIKDENKEKWIHFDIAGSAYSESVWDCNPYGATGAGVRLLSSFLSEIK